MCDSADPDVEMAEKFHKIVRLARPTLLDSFEIVIPEHTIKRYVERVFDEPTDYIPKSLKKRAEKEIREAVYSPELVYHEKEDMPPICVGERVAVVFDASKGGDGNILIPTIYLRSKSPLTESEGAA